MEGPEIRRDKMWCVNENSLQQMSPADAWRHSMSWLLPLRALFGVRCTSFQRCFLNLCSGSSLFSCLLFQQLCHLFNKDNRRLYPDDCTRLLYSSFGFICFWLLTCAASYGFQCSDGPIFLPANKNGYRCPGVPVCRQWTFLNGGRKIQVFWDMTTCSWIISSRRFGGYHVFLAEQFNIERLDPEGLFINLSTALFMLY